MLWPAGRGNTQSIFTDEVTADGLHKVDPSILTNVWVRPDRDLSRYTRVFFTPAVIQFSELPPPSERSWVAASNDEFAVSDLMREELRELFGEAFQEAAAGVRSHEPSTELGRDVLMVRGVVSNVTTGIPPDHAGSNVNMVRWAWKADIIVEVRDSMSDEVLARTFERQHVNGPFDADLIMALAPRVTRNWSGLIVRRLRELSSLYPSRLRRLQEESELGGSRN